MLDMIRDVNKVLSTQTSSTLEKTTGLQKAVFALTVVMRQNGRWNGSMNEKRHSKGVTIWWLLGNNNRQYYLYMFSGYIADDIVISIIPIYAWKNAYHQMKISQRTSLGLPQWLVSCKRFTFTTSWFFYVKESFYLNRLEWRGNEK